MEPSGEEKHDTPMSGAGGTTQHPGQISLSVTPEAQAIGHNTAKTVTMMCSLQAPFYELETRAPVQLVCVIDHSGSMRGTRLELVCNSLKFIIKNLSKTDSLCLVAYETSSKTILPFIEMTGEGKKKASKVIDKIRATGRTNLIGGLLNGIEEFEKQPADGQVRSILLFTDGQANIGYTHAADVIRATVDTAFAAQGPMAGHRSGTIKAEMTVAEVEFLLEKAKEDCKSSFQSKDYASAAKTQAKINKYHSIIEGRLLNRSEPWRQTLQVGSRVIVDCNGSDNMASIAEVRDNHLIVVSYDGWSSRYDEPLDIGSDRLKMYRQSLPVHDRKLTSTLNTFGFGEDHEEDLLKAISDHGSGIYYYIEGANLIAEAFADCLGGLLSMVGEKLKLQIQMIQPEGLQGATFSAVINKDLKQKQTVLVEGEIIELDLGDIQSEEERDILFTVKLPALERTIESYPILKATLAYKNVVLQQEESVDADLSIWRPDDEECKDPEVNEKLNIQSNRLLAAAAIEEANLLGKSDLPKARKTIETAMTEIQNSPTAKDTFCVGLITDLKDCLDGLVSRSSYKSYGSKRMWSHSSSHYRQRVTNTSYSTQMHYSNNSRGVWSSQAKDDPDLYK